MVNNFLPFANDPSTANVETQADYLAAASGNGYVQNGFSAGTASSKAANKALRQSTVMASAIGDFIAGQLSQDVLDSGGSAAVTALAAQIASAIKAAVQSGAGNYAADSGTANAMVATLSPAPTALATGMTVRIKKAAAANTGATTLNLNALGVKPVVDEENNALVAGQIAASSILSYTYDGTSWRVSKPKATSVGAAGSTTQVQFNNGGVLGASANLVWDDTNARVGVGASSPSSKVHVRGDGSAGWANCGVLLDNTGTSGRNYSIASRESGKFSVADETASAERLVIDASGNVGLGVSAPQGKLHAYGNTWPVITAENPSDHASIGLKGNSGQACVLHYGASGGGNELRFGRWSSDFATWQANPVRLDMDAPDGSFVIGNDGTIATVGVINAPGFYGVGAAPVGAYASWPTEDVPTGWLECNGATISRTTYATLYAVLGNRYGAGDGSTTFQIPDVRGHFPRFWNHGQGTDPDAASRTNRGDGITGDWVGTKQWDQLGSHAHSYSKPKYAPANSGTGWGILAEESGTTGSTGGNETRPRNVNVMLIIRAY